MFSTSSRVKASLASSLVHGRTWLATTIVLNMPLELFFEGSARWMPAICARERRRVSSAWGHHRPPLKPPSSALPLPHLDAVARLAGVDKVVLEKNLDRAGQLTGGRAFGHLLE